MGFEIHVASHEIQYLRLFKISFIATFGLTATFSTLLMIKNVAGTKCRKNCDDLNRAILILKVAGIQGPLLEDRTKASVKTRGSVDVSTRLSHSSRL